jgi:hypothetical protein
MCGGQIGELGSTVGERELATRISVPKTTASESDCSIATATLARFATTVNQGPDRKWGVCSVGGLLVGGERGRIEGTTKKSELSSFHKKFDARFRSKSKFWITYEGFSDHLSQKNT